MLSNALREPSAVTREASDVAGKGDDRENHDTGQGHGHAHHGARGNGTTPDYSRDFFHNLNAYEGPLTEKVRLTLRNRFKAYFVPPVRGCCGHPGEPGC